MFLCNKYNVCFGTDISQDLFRFTLAAKRKMSVGSLVEIKKVLCQTKNWLLMYPHI